MATTVVTPQRATGITIRTVITELQWILELSTDSPKDPRLKQLLEDAKNDLATAAAKIPIADDPLITK
jgi:hypothetical protein